MNSCTMYPPLTHNHLVPLLRSAWVRSICQYGEDPRIRGKASADYIACVLECVHGQRRDGQVGSGNSGMYKVRVAV